MKRTLKLFALLLALVMVITLLPTAALAEGQSPDDVATETPAPNGYIRSPEHGTHAVDRAEWAVQQPCTILIDARINYSHVPDNLNDKARDAGDHEDPEKVEKV